MAIVRWRGDAVGVSQVDYFYASNIDIGDTFTLTCNRKSISYTAKTTSPTEVYGGLAAIINTVGVTLPPEFAETVAGVVADQNGVQCLQITGKIDGTPFTFTSTATFGGGTVTIRELVKGSAAIDAQQTISLAGPPTGGTFTLSYGGYTTAALAYNASAATIQTALTGLTSIGGGNATVTGITTTSWLVDFGGAFAGLPVNLITGSGASLTGGCSVAGATTTQGSPSTNEVQSFVPPTSSTWLYGTTSGPFTLQSQWTGPNGSTGNYSLSNASWANAPTAIQQAIVLAGYTANDVQVTAAYDQNGVALTITATYVGTLAGTNVNQLTLTLTPAAGSSYQCGTTTTDGSSTAINEVQTITILGGPTGGTFTLSFNGSTTAGIAYNASAATVQTAFTGLGTVGAGNCTITGSAGGPYTLTFVSGLAGTNVNQTTGSGTSLTGDTVAVQQTRNPTAAANEQQSVALGSSTTGGTFTLTFGANTTAGLAYNAAAATIQTALTGLGSIGGGNATVTGANGGPWTVTFTGSMAATPEPLMSGNGASLTGGSMTFTRVAHTVPTGPYHADNVNNWSSGSLPANSDTIKFENTGNTMKYGLAQQSISPTNIIIEANFTGQIGLPDYNASGGYYEYRQKAWQIGTNGPMYVYVGVGDGTGSNLLRISTGGCQTELDVYQTANPTVQTASLMWDGTHASNAVNVYRGNVGIAMDSGVVATVNKLQMSFIQGKEADAYVTVGDGVTLNSVLKDGGYLLCNCAIVTNFEQNAGQTDLNGSGACAALQVRGGVFNYNSNGNLNGTPIVSLTGLLDFTHNMLAKVVANPILVYGDSSDVLDPNKVCTTTGFTAGDFVVDYYETTRLPQLGRNYRLIRRAHA